MKQSPGRVGMFPLCLLLSLAFAQVSLAQTQAPCYVCRRQDRFIIDRNTTFDLTDLLGQTRTYTCGELEDIGINDLTVSNTVCGLFIAHVEAECECGGPPITPPDVIDTTPGCDICIDGRAVPEVKADQFVDTGIAGEMPCGFIYTSAADGFLPAPLCPILQQNVAEFCCSVPEEPPCQLGVDCPVDEEDAPTPAPAPAIPHCGSMRTDCRTNNDCCGALVCKLRCATPNVRSRQSVAGGNRGGAAGRAEEEYAN